MGSVSSELRKNIMCVMKDEKERNISELKTDLTAEQGFEYGRDYGEGHLAGILRVLTTNKELEKTGRGRYRLYKKERRQVSMTDMDYMLNLFIEDHENEQQETVLAELNRRTLINLEEQYKDLVKRMDAVALSSLSSADFESLKQLSEVKEDLKTLLMKYGRMTPS